MWAVWSAIAFRCAAAYICANAMFGRFIGGLSKGSAKGRFLRSKTKIGLTYNTNNENIKLIYYMIPTYLVVSKVKTYLLLIHI